MAITLPDSGAQLGEALARIGQSVGDLINPNADFHKKVREAFTTSSEFGQGLADLKFTNEGVLPSIFARSLPKDVIEGINLLQPSLKAYDERAAKKGIASFTADELAAYNRARAVREGLVGSAQGLAVATQVPGAAQQPPGQAPTTLAEQGAQHAVGGMTSGQAAANAIRSRLGPVANGYLDSLMEHDKQYGTNYYEQAAGEQFSLFDAEHYRDVLAEREKLTKERQVDRLIPIQMTRASWWLQQSGIGDPELWRDFWYNQKTIKRLAEIKSTGARTPEDITLLRMDNFRETLGAKAQRADYMASTITRDKMVEWINGNPSKKILPDDPTRRAGHLAQLNDELVLERNPFEAFWGPSVDQTDTTEKLRFRSRAHKNLEVKPDQVYQLSQQADMNFMSGGSGGTPVHVEVNPPVSENATPTKPPVITQPSPQPTGSLNQRRADYANQLIQQGMGKAAAIQRAKVEVQ